MPTTSPTLLWLRTDLRLGDNPALFAAVAHKGAVIPVFLWMPAEEGRWQPGGATRWWLDASLRALDASLRERGSRLVVRRGPALETLRTLIGETGATTVHWNRRYEPDAIARDRQVKEGLRADGIEARSFNGSLLMEPWENVKGDGTAYRVFTPFWKSMLARGAMAAPVAAPKRLTAPSEWPASDTIDDLGLKPRLDWAGGMRAAWTPGEKGAHLELERFLSGAVTLYPETRDRPDLVGTSRLSPHLHFGEIGPRQAWHAAREFALGDSAERSAGDSERSAGDTDRSDRRVSDADSRAADAEHADVSGAVEAWLRQLAWREFGHHLLYHFPHTAEAPLRPEFERFPWAEDDAALRAWQRGRTGYPIVDAGMRELWTTGWMHNRVRMVVASFLVKDLLLPWQEGARWFWDTLVDADLANNTLGWQWTAGCGADAAPYFRVFNPLLQSRKFDPDAAYLRRWLPELAELPDPWIHEPHKAPTDVLEAAGVLIGRDYPAPIVSHEVAKHLALAAYQTITRKD